MKRLILTSLSADELKPFLIIPLDVDFARPDTISATQLSTARVVIIIEKTLELQLASCQLLANGEERVILVALTPMQLATQSFISDQFLHEHKLVLDYITVPITQHILDMRLNVWRQLLKSKQQMNQFQNLLQDFFQTLPELAWYKDNNLRYQSVNDAFTAYSGLAVEEIIGKTDAEIWQGKALPEIAQLTDVDILATGQSRSFSSIFPGNTHSGYFQVNKFPIFNIYDEPVGIFGFAQDLTTLKNTQNELQITLDSLPMGACIRDTDGTLLYFNELYDVFYDRPLAVGENIFDPQITPLAEHREFIRFHDQRVIETAAPIIYQNTVEIDGDERIIEFTKSPIIDFDGRVIRILLLLRDITEIVEQEERIRKLAFNDSLTGVANRSGLYEQLDQFQNSPLFGAIFSIDIVNFKRYNENFGHDFGNALLRTVAKRLQAAYPAAFISRDSDEFTLFLTFTSQPSEQLLTQLAKNLLASFDTPLLLQQTNYLLDIRIGYASSALTVPDFTDTINQSEFALKIAKASSETRFLAYDQQLVNQAQLHEQFLLAFEQALQTEAITLFYQPQYTCEQQLIGFEALFRWPNNPFPQFNVGEMIAMIEKTSMIHQLGHYVLEKAMQFAELINANRSQYLTVAVNLSAYQVMDPDFLKIVDHTLTRYVITPAMIDLEITETVLLEDLTTNIAKFAELKDRGFKISLDDFGTGYSSLNYLASLPLSTVKIDRSFICELTNEKKYRTLVKMIVEAAHALDLHVVAEGVETIAELEILKTFATDYIQGFYFSKPLPATEAFALALQVD